MEFFEICLLIQDLIRDIVNKGYMTEDDKCIIFDIFVTIENLEERPTDTLIAYYSTLVHLTDLLNDNTTVEFNKKLEDIKLGLVSQIYGRKEFAYRKNGTEPTFSQVFTEVFIR